MNPILFDTNGYSAFKRGDPKAIEIVRNARSMAINATVLGELLIGFSLGRKEAENRRELNEFIYSPLVQFLPIIETTAERYAVIEKMLRQAGTPIPTNDIWIAASALEHGMDLFSHDAHFRHIPALRTGTNLADFAAA